MVWVAGAGSLVLVGVTAVGLVDVFRYRDRISTSQLVAWMVFIVVVPIVGLVSYALWRVSRSDTMEESIDFQKEHPVEGEQHPPIQQG